MCLLVLYYRLPLACLCTLVFSAAALSQSLPTENGRGTAISASAIPQSGPASFRRRQRLLRPAKRSPSPLAVPTSRLCPPRTVIVCAGASSGDGDGGSAPSSPTRLLAGVVTSIYASLFLLYRSRILTGYPLDLDLNSVLLRDISMGFFAATLATLWVKIWTSQVNSDGIGGLNPKLSRKIIHTTSAPLFLFIWPLFSHIAGNEEGLTSPARFFAATVPLLNVIKLYLAGKSEDSGNELSRAISRSGDPKEALGGPLLYAVVTMLVIILSWTDDLRGIVAIMVMAVGDGMADIIGRRYGSVKWPFSDTKSIAGTLAFFVTSSISLIGMLNWLSFTGALPSSIVTGDALLDIKLLAICAICAAVELLPFGDDNWTVPLTGYTLAAVLLG